MPVLNIVFQKWDFASLCFFPYSCYNSQPFERFCVFAVIFSCLKNPPLTIAVTAVFMITIFQQFLVDHLNNFHCLPFICHLRFKRFFGCLQIFLGFFFLNPTLKKLLSITRKINQGSLEKSSASSSVVSWNWYMITEN